MVLQPFLVSRDVEFVLFYVFAQNDLAFVE